VNSYVSCTKTTSVFCWFGDIFPSISSLDFPAERFLVFCARETLINEWDARGNEISEGVHSLGWTGQGKRVGGKLG
jgi:hypothetical protein